MGWNYRSSLRLRTTTVTLPASTRTCACCTHRNRRWCNLSFMHRLVVRSVRVSKRSLKATHSDLKTNVQMIQSQKATGCGFITKLAVFPFFTTNVPTSLLVRINSLLVATFICCKWHRLALRMNSRRGIGRSAATCFTSSRKRTFTGSPSDTFGHSHKEGGFAT